MKFRKKPVEIESVQFTEENLGKLREWLGRQVDATFEWVAWEPPTLTIHTLEGDMVARYGDWIIKGVKGEFYPCRQDIFEETYEAVE